MTVRTFDSHDNGIYWLSLHERLKSVIIDSVFVTNTELFCLVVG